jgi:hypothetical protein
MAWFMDTVSLFHGHTELGVVTGKIAESKRKCRGEVNHVLVVRNHNPLMKRLRGF